MSDCVIWWGTIAANGYGVGKYRGQRKMFKAHRFVYEECFGPIPDNMLVRHSCDNPPCVNPEHLLLGTPQDNMDDKMERGRGVFPGAPIKTHCVRGHAFDEENTRWVDKEFTTRSGETHIYRTQACRACARWHSQQYRLRQKAVT